MPAKKGKGKSHTQRRTTKRRVKKQNVRSGDQPSAYESRQYMNALAEAIDISRQTGTCQLCKRKWKEPTRKRSFRERFMFI